MVVFWAICLGLSACKGEQQKVAHEEIQQQESMIFTVKEPAFPEFNAATGELLLSWPAFQDFQREAEELNDNTLTELKSRTRRLITYSDSIIRSIPDSLNTQSVYARLLVVNNNVRLFHQELNKDQLDSATVAANLEDLLLATSNFYQQINQKLLKDAIDMQREEDEKNELEQQKQFLDSVLQEELKDNNMQDL